MRSILLRLSWKLCTTLSIAFRQDNLKEVAGHKEDLACVGQDKVTIDKKKKGGVFIDYL